MLRFTTMRPTKIDLSFFPGISWNFRLDTVLTYHSTYYYKKKDWRGKGGEIQKWKKCDFYCFYKNLRFESIFIISLVAEWVKASDLTILLKGGGFKSCQSQVFFSFKLYCSATLNDIYPFQMILSWLNMSKNFCASYTNF